MTPFIQDPQATAYLGFLGIHEDRTLALLLSTEDFVQPNQIDVFGDGIRFYDLTEDQIRTIGWIANHLAGQGGDMFWAGNLLDCNYIREHYR